MAKKIIVLKKYLNYIDIILKESAVKLPKHLDINKPVIILKMIFLNLFLKFY